MRIEDLTDEQIDGMWVCNLDLAIAYHVFGYETSGEGANGLIVHDEGVCPPDDYASSLEEAWDMERRLAELGLAERYADALASLQPHYNSDMPTISLFDIAHASPRDRCRAALRAVRDAKQREGDDD